jgi:hypothetical protein
LPAERIDAGREPVPRNELPAVGGEPTLDQKVEFLSGPSAYAHRSA